MLFYIKDLIIWILASPGEGGGVPEPIPSGYGGVTVSRTLGCTQQWLITNLPPNFHFKIKIILTIQISVCVCMFVYICFLKPYKYFLLQYKNSFLNTLTSALPQTTTLECIFFQTFYFTSHS